MIEKTFICDSCGKEHTIKIREDYDEESFLTVCSETGEGVYVVIEE